MHRNTNPEGIKTMGYTHYFTQKRRFTNAEWQAVKTDVARIIESAESLQVRFDGVQLPNVAKVEAGEVISFNGVGDDAHEDFWLAQERPARQSWQDAGTHGFQFCKTARKPYDIAVAAVVLYLGSVYPGTIKTASDGTLQDLQPGLDLARRALPHLADAIQMPESVVWDSRFKAWPISGNRLFVAETVGGEIVIADHDARKILATFSGEVVADIAPRVIAMRDKLPRFGRSDEIYGAADRAAKRLLDAAETLGGIVH
jgi:hypothetical protein